MPKTPPAMTVSLVRAAISATPQQDGSWVVMAEVTTDGRMSEGVTANGATLPDALERLADTMRKLSLEFRT